MRQKIAASHGLGIDPESQITVTLGATEAIYSAIQAIVGPGDEAIAFDPAYDSYDPAVRLAGGRCIRLALQPPGFRYDWDAVRAAITRRTRLILFNSPHNPACTAASAEDLDALADIAAERDIFVISDEVYEHVTYDGHRHASVLSHPELATTQLRGVLVRQDDARHRHSCRLLHRTHRAHARAAQGPSIQHLQHRHAQQQAIAAYLTEKPDAWRGLPAFFQAKRDRLRNALASSRFRLPPAQGTYFQLLDFSELAACR